MKTVYFTAGLLALSAGAAHADSLSNAGKASTDSAVATGELAESGVKLVAGAVAVPLQVGGSVAVVPGGSMAAGGALSEYLGIDGGESIKETGLVVAAPGAIAIMAGRRLEKFSDEPLVVSSETMSGKAARQTQTSDAEKAGTH